MTGSGGRANETPRPKFNERDWRIILAAVVMYAREQGGIDREVNALRDRLVRLDGGVVNDH